MSRVLHITNGDVVATGLRNAGVDGLILPWRDMLHDGPVAAGLSLEEQSRSRARFLAELLDEPYVEMLEGFRSRDRQLATFRDYDEVWLWFEHDLYDQLQLLQIVDWFSRRSGSGLKLSLICIDRFAGIEPFHGLGQLDSAQLRSLEDQRKLVTTEALQEAAEGWRLFCGSNPMALQQFADREPEQLRFMQSALLRHLQQFPSTRDGLSRSEHQILLALAAGPLDLGTLFRRSQQEAEEAPFVSDTLFRVYVEWLRADESLVEWTGSDPVSLWHRPLQLTGAGQQVLEGRADRTRFQALDRWLGGVHLLGQDPTYRCTGGKPQLTRSDS